MRFKPTEWGFTTILIVIMGTWVALSQHPAFADTPQLSDYDVIQYAMIDGFGPQNIMELDNNGEIVLACVNGTTEDELRKLGISFVQSQVTLLKTWRVLQLDGEVLRTAFPILDRARTEKLRAITRAAAPEVCRRLQPRVTKLTGTLESLGRQGNAYSILFAYVVDGMVWDVFEENNLVNKKHITADRPFWAGEVWAVYPPREFRPGTNSLSDKGVSLKVNWSEEAIPKMIPFLADWKNLLQILDDYINVGRVVDKQAKEVFAPFNLFDTSGRFTIPIVEETPDNQLFQICHALSHEIVDIAPGVLDLPGLTAAFGFRDEKQTVVIAYHELMWDLMDIFTELGLVQKPLAFADPDNSEPQDIADLVFIVKSGTVGKQ
ncbi:MAG: hypothetical protein OEW00_04655 [candidate division Zixibacteria bacterium]|nr:hypothetical protein [candidate division Zixibacteria bacterium]